MAASAGRGGCVRHGGIRVCTTARQDHTSDQHGVSDLRCQSHRTSPNGCMRPRSAINGVRTALTARCDVRQPCIAFQNSIAEADHASPVDGDTPPRSNAKGGVLPPDSAGITAHEHRKRVHEDAGLIRVPALSWTTNARGRSCVPATALLLDAWCRRDSNDQENPCRGGR